MKVQVLGPGCPKCKKLAENAEAAAREVGSDVQVVKVTDIDEIVKSGVMLTPGLAVNGKVKSAGRVPDIEEIKRWIVESKGSDDASR
jgi:small redox-active disulfide protein 2